ncbi:MAG: translation initiation factor IF-3 [Proteobacteria bacterium]|nr:translation initiation factor IF-3 [Pseudomonadota bacterium]
MNELIRVPQVRVVDDEGEQLGVMETADAITVAEDKGLDLVEVSATAKPPVCRIMDYGKYKYQMSKKARETKKKQTVILVKEMKFRVKTDEHDFQFKVRNIKRFLNDGNKVKVILMFRGREITHTELGREKLNRVGEELKEIATIDSHPRLEGRNMTMMLAPITAK